MKKIYALLVCLSLLTGFYSCESNYVSHVNVGKHVFQMLQTLDTLPIETFRSHFIPIEEIKNMAANIKEGKKLIPKVSEMTEVAYVADIDQIYHTIRQNGESNSILWKNTEFVDYKYQTSRNRSMTLNYGTLFFKHTNKKYSVEIYWLTDLKVSGLLGFGRLQNLE